MPTLFDWEGKPYWAPPHCPRVYHEFIWYTDTDFRQSNLTAMLAWTDEEMVEDYRRAIRGNGDYYFIIVELPEIETAFRLRFG